VDGAMFAQRAKENEKKSRFGGFAKQNATFYPQPDFFPWKRTNSRGQNLSTQEIHLFKVRVCSST